MEDLGPLGPAVSVLITFMAQEGDTPCDTQRKVTAVLCTVICLVLCGFGAATPTATAFGRVASISGGSCSLVLLTVALLRRKYSISMCVMLVAMVCGLISATDVAGMPMFLRKWSLFILVLDALLGARLPRWLVNSVVGYAVVHMIVCQTELTFRFGLLDAPGLASYDSRKDICDCKQPPCASNEWDAVVFTGSLDIIIFGLDFLMTRMFADAAAMERRRMESVIEASGVVADSLAHFDLQSAEEYLVEHGDQLPPEQLASFETLLANLASYRPFLPSEFFAEAHVKRRTSSKCSSLRYGSSTEQMPVDIPGGLTGRAAIVFTDIRQSTALWGHSGESMYEALQRHNALIRACAEKHSGYEVKTIGDAFMVALNTAEEAVRFGVDTQIGLEEATWPETLNRPGYPDDGFAILTIRVGVHVGAVSAELNTLTQRYDYFGATVNTAARVEQNGYAGVVTITPAVREEAQALLATLTVVDYGTERYGKGLSEVLWLTAVLPAEVSVAALTLCQAFVTQPVPDAHGSLVKVVRRPLWSNRKYLSGEMPGSPCSSFDETVHSLTSSDDMGASTAGSPVAESRAASLLFNRQHRTTASVGAIQFDRLHAAEAEAIDFEIAEACASERLHILHTTLQGTGGHLTAVINTLALVSWGVHGKCTQPLNESARFLTRLYDRYRGGPCMFRAGLATGEVASGQLAAAPKQQFITLLGPCVDLSLALCAGAAELEVAALCASISESNMDYYNLNPILAPHVTCVDHWSFVEDRVFPVFKLRVDDLARVLGGQSDSLAVQKETSYQAVALPKFAKRLQHALIRHFREQDIQARTSVVIAEPSTASILPVSPGTGPSPGAGVCPKFTPPNVDVDAGASPAFSTSISD
eukprot:TRINITY_DN4965_c0_g1_i1.p1 TRINITY_DN4965_c0_g1~~TRINITY_DN4965_c0_g1_i1.p1  ORF type:complete len:873 (+),score=239.41 TRINITY_DN4965_c0_g1_i1:70-2688(+)